MRSLCDSEEQRLLEQVLGEEERAHQSILTQQAHWTEALRKLDTLRTSLVGMLTHLDDLQLYVSQERVRTQKVGQVPQDLKTSECQKDGLGTGMSDSDFYQTCEAVSILAHHYASVAKNPANSAWLKAPTTDI